MNLLLFLSAVLLATAHEPADGAQFVRDFVRTAHTGLSDEPVSLYALQGKPTLGDSIPNGTGVVSRVYRFRHGYV
jgi:hypothetical protein